MPTVARASDHPGPFARSRPYRVKLVKVPESTIDALGFIQPRQFRAVIPDNDDD